MQDARDADMELDHGIEDFLVCLRVRRQLAPRTVRNYYGYNVLAPWCREHGLDQVEQLTDTEVDQFSMHLEDRRNRNDEPLHPATRAAYLKALRLDYPGVDARPDDPGAL